MAKFEQTTIEDFLGNEPLTVPIIRESKKTKSTLERIEERLARIETLLSGGQISASVTVTRPALTGEPSRPMRRPSALAAELKELMGIDASENYLGTPKEILAALRNRVRIQ